MPRNARSKNSGNMLIYILGAIFLLGLLIVLVKGSFQEGTGIDAEKVLIQSSEIQRFAAEVERGVNYVLQNNYAQSDLRFANPLNDASYAGYGTISTTPNQQVFSPQGGGAEWRYPPTGSQVTTTPWVFTARNAVQDIGSTCATASCVDLLAVLPNVTKDFCIRLNDEKGITNPSGNPPKEADSLNLTAFTAGAFTYSQDLNVTGGYTDGRPEGCIEGNGGDTSAGSYYYYRVLLAR